MSTAVTHRIASEIADLYRKRGEMVSEITDLEGQIQQAVSRPVTQSSVEITGGAGTIFRITVEETHPLIVRRQGG